jgi:hypothetical protein
MGKLQFFETEKKLFFAWLLSGQYDALVLEQKEFNYK